jgi:hypothetical protein
MPHPKLFAASPVGAPRQANANPCPRHHPAGAPFHAPVGENGFVPNALTACILLDLGGRMASFGKSNPWAPAGPARARRPKPFLSEIQTDPSAIPARFPN